MKTGLASVLLPLLLHSAAPAAAYEKGGKHFINWDAHEFPIVSHWNWHRPFPDHGEPPMGFETKCNVVKKFHARNYRLGDLRSGEGHPLYQFSDAIEKFIAGRTYPGSWDGVDHGGMQRDLLMMDWRELPVYVRRWIEDNEMRRPEMDDGRTWRFMVLQRKSKKQLAKEKEKEEKEGTRTPTGPLRAIPTEGVESSKWSLPDVADRDKVVFFAPGQLYPILPLFNAKGGGKCEDSFSDLSRYVPAAKDDSVVAWPFEHSKPDLEHGKNEIYFKIRTEHVLELEHNKNHRMLWDTLMRNARRTERKHLRAEREAGRESLGMPERDEL